MSINRDRGKRAEGVIAKRLGGKRIGTLCGEDVQHETWSIEVKSRQAFVGQSFMEQCIRNAPQGKVPLVIIHLHGKNHGDDLVMMRLKDFEAFNGEVSGYPE